MKLSKLCMHRLLFCTHYYAWRFYFFSLFFAEGEAYKKDKGETDLQKNNQGLISNVNLRSVCE